MTEAVKLALPTATVTDRRPSIFPSANSSPTIAVGAPARDRHDARAPQRLRRVSTLSGARWRHTVIWPPSTETDRPALIQSVYFEFGQHSFPRAPASRYRTAVPSSSSIPITPTPCAHKRTFHTIIPAMAPTTDARRCCSQHGRRGAAPDAGCDAHTHARFRLQPAGGYRGAALALWAHLGRRVPRGSGGPRGHRAVASRARCDDAEDCRTRWGTPRRSSSTELRAHGGADRAATAWLSGTEARAGRRTPRRESTRANRRDTGQP